MEQITYKKAPLLELIVQIQWQVNAFGVQGAPQIVTDNSSHFDIWFHEITSKFSALGYTQLERLVPHDMPPMAYKPIFRYKQPDQNFPVIQFGHGIFTINAGPPNYDSWGDFSPTVSTVLDILIDSIPQGLDLNNFTHLSMRYLDVFNGEMRNNLSNFEFMKTDLGISINFPINFAELSKNEDDINPTIAFNLPIKDDPSSKLAFQISSGRVGASELDLDTVMDMTYIIDESINISSKDILSRLNGAYTTLHKWFMEITNNIHLRMSPNTEK